jgi:hypothetical protein
MTGPSDTLKKVHNHPFPYAHEDDPGKFSHSDSFPPLLSAFGMQRILGYHWRTSRHSAPSDWRSPPSKGDPRHTSGHSRKAIIRREKSHDQWKGSRRVTRLLAGACGKGWLWTPLKFQKGSLCFTLLCPASGYPRNGLTAVSRVACPQARRSSAVLLPLWTPHACTPLTPITPCRPRRTCFQGIN